MTFVAGEARDGHIYVPDVAYCCAARDAKGVSKLEGQTTLVAEAYAMQTVFEKANGRGVVAELAFTLDGASHQAVGVLGEKHTHTLQGEQGFDASEDGTGRGTPVVAIRTSDTKANGIGIQDEAAYTLQRGVGQAIAFGELDVPREDGTTPSVRTADPSIFAMTHVCDDADCPGAERCARGMQVGADTVVRRLTPVECARLQGFPDDWCCLCGKDACTCADGPRYKAYGNAVTVSVLQYLGGRIVAFEREEGRL